MFDDVVVVYKFIGDLMFYVSGHQDENEVILFNVLTAFCDSVTLLLRWVGWCCHAAAAAAAAVGQVLPSRCYCGGSGGSSAGTEEDTPASLVADLVKLEVSSSCAVHYC